MSKGIELYKKLIEIIMTQATVCIKNLTTDSQVKRRGWVEIDNSTHVTFTKPGPLVRLAYIVTDNVKVNILHESMITFLLVSIKRILLH